MFKLRGLLTLFCLFLCQNLFALYMGEDGDPIVKNQVKWQPIKYEDQESGFTALLPGEPVCGMHESSVYASSKFKGAWYIIFTDTASHYLCPNSEKSFIRQVENAFKEKKVKIISRPSNQRNVRYIAEIYNLETHEILLLLCSHNHLYFASFTPGKNKDQYLMEDFFNSVKITK